MPGIDPLLMHKGSVDGSKDALSECGETAETELEDSKDYNLEDISTKVKKPVGDQLQMLRAEVREGSNNVLQYLSGCRSNFLNVVFDTLITVVERRRKKEVGWRKSSRCRSRQKNFASSPTLSCCVEGQSE